MKKTALWVICVTLIILGACKNVRPDMSGLLKTVPSSAGMVVGIHLKSLAEDAGCKVSDNEIKPGNEVKEMISKMSDSDRAEVINLLGGSSGIVPDYAILFIDANRTFLTLSLYDVNKFKEFVKKDKETDFTDAGSGVQLCQNIAIKGNQVWVCLSSSKQIDPDAIVNYASLSQSQSFLNTDMAKVILEGDDDVIGWGKINTVLSHFMSLKDMTLLSIASNLIYDDADAIEFTLDFEKGEMEASAIVLNEKGKPAKYLLPLEKIDTKTITALEGSCDALLAMNITPKLIQKIEKLSSAFGGGILANLKETLKNVDGTVAIAIGAGQEAISAIITTKGQVSNELNTLLSMTMDNVNQDGNYLRCSRGNLTGGMTVATCADNLKGDCLGLVADFQSLKVNSGSYNNLPSSISTVTFAGEPHSGGLRLKMEVKTADDKENFLMSVIKAL